MQSANRAVDEMSYKFNFLKLEVWQLARVLNRQLFDLTKNFPSDEKFGLISQIRRASVFIASNLADGSAKNSKKDQAHFSTIAFSSTMEVLNLLILAKDLDYINEEVYSTIRPDVEKLANKINALKQSQLASIERIHKSTITQ